MNDNHTPPPTGPAPAPTLDQLDAGTAAAIRNLIDYHVEKEHGADVDDHIGGATMIAIAGLELHLRPAHLAAGGTDQQLRGLAQTTLRILLRDGLAARRCQCPNMGPARAADHGHRDTCAGHYEADVPPIDGFLLCGSCHIPEFQHRAAHAG